MKIVPVICFALATAVAGIALPVSSSHALTYPNAAQNCAVTDQQSSEGVGNCKQHKDNRAETRSLGRSVSADPAGQAVIGMRR